MRETVASNSIKIYGNLADGYSMDIDFPKGGSVAEVIDMLTLSANVFIADEIEEKFQSAALYRSLANLIGVDEVRAREIMAHGVGGGEDES